MKKSDFFFELPDELIAQYPAERGESKLLILHRDSGEIEHKKFRKIIDYIKEGDCVVINDTKVIPARFYGYRESTNGKMEILLIEGIGDRRWKVLVSPGKKGRVGDVLVLENKFRCIVESIEEKTGERIVRFEDEEKLFEYGSVPLPPYISREATEIDKVRYQTIYAKREGAVAAPTAGLHFDQEILERLTNKGVKMATITLHVGPGTFRPVLVEDVNDHQMESERYEVKEVSSRIINETIENGGKIFAVGTTTVRVLETVARQENRIKSKKGRTNLFIYPPFKFKIVDHLITNFHLPGSTLIMLVSAFASGDRILHTYNIAIEKGYRFYSYGDAMLIL